jgi:RNA polymerase Rpb1 C-terminal repeat
LRSAPEVVDKQLVLTLFTARTCTVFSHKPGIQPDESTGAYSFKNTLLLDTFELVLYSRMPRAITYCYLQYSPTSPAYSPTSPQVLFCYCGAVNCMPFFLMVVLLRFQYSPTSPAYSPTSPQVRKPVLSLRIYVCNCSHIKFTWHAVLAYQSCVQSN